MRGTEEVFAGVGAESMVRPGWEKGSAVSLPQRLPISIDKDDDVREEGERGLIMDVGTLRWNNFADEIDVAIAVAMAGLGCLGRRPCRLGLGAGPKRKLD